MSAILEREITQTADEPQPFRWNIEAYYEMAERGLFDNRRVELIEGEIVQMSPMLKAHAAALWRTDAELRRIFNDESGHALRAQMPMRLSDNSEPEPDILIMQGSGRDFDEGHPTTAALIVEISDSTLRYDRTIKAGLYARAGVAEYWILNLQARQLETFRAPIEDGDARFGWRYSETKTYSESEEVAPSESPQHKISVAALLPRGQ